MPILKNPTKSFTLNENSFIYGIINAVPYILTFALSIYFLINTVYKLLQNIFSGGTSSSLPFFPIVLRVSISLIIIVIVTLGAIFSLLKLVSKQIEFKKIVIQYCSLFTPFIILNIVSWLTGLSGSFLATAIILLISFMFTIYIIPGFITYELDSHPTVLTQKVYLSFAAIVLAMIITYIVARIIVFNYFRCLILFILMKTDAMQTIHILWHPFYVYSFKL